MTRLSQAQRAMLKKINRGQDPLEGLGGGRQDAWAMVSVRALEKKGLIEDGCVTAQGHEVLNRKRGPLKSEEPIGIGVFVKHKETGRYGEVYDFSHDKIRLFPVPTANYVRSVWSAHDNELVEVPFEEVKGLLGRQEGDPTKAEIKARCKECRERRELERSRIKIPKAKKDRIRSLLRAGASPTRIAWIVNVCEMTVNRVGMEVQDGR